MFEPLIYWHSFIYLEVRHDGSSVNFWNVCLNYLITIEFTFIKIISRAPIFMLVWDYWNSNFHFHFFTIVSYQSFLWFFFLHILLVLIVFLSLVVVVGAIFCGPSAATHGAHVVVLVAILYRHWVRTKLPWPLETCHDTKSMVLYDETKVLYRSRDWFDVIIIHFPSRRSR